MTFVGGAYWHFITFALGCLKPEICYCHMYTVDSAEVIVKALLQTDCTKNQNNKHKCTIQLILHSYLQKLQHQQKHLPYAMKLCKNLLLKCKNCFIFYLFCGMFLRPLWSLIPYVCCIKLHGFSIRYELYVLDCYQYNINI